MPVAPSYAPGVTFPEATSSLIATVPDPASASHAEPVLPGPNAGATWMRSLSEHYARVRSLHPDEDLCVVFDIDGTILDMRHLVVHVLLAYDGRHGTDHFRGLVADDITHHEDDVDRLLASLAVPSAARRDVAMFARTHLWDREAILASSRPFEGVFGVIRWFQLQPRTHIALNTGRSHRLRDQTLASLNTIGAAYRVRFDQDMLFTADPGADVPASKVTALGQLRDRAFRVVAVVDNEPENLRAMAMNDPTGEILYLHADTIFRSRRIHPDPLVSGRLYHLREFVPERTLPGRIELVWHGVNDEANLAQFLASDVRWAEVDVRRDPVGRLVLRHDGFDESPWKRDEETPFAHDVVRRIAAAARSVKLDIKEDGATLEQSIQLADSLGLEDDRLWFNAELPVLGYRGFRALRRRFPGSTISAPVDLVAPLLLASEAMAHAILDEFAGWGISRLSLPWTPLARRMLDALEAEGWEVNLYGIPDLEAFLEASLLLPTSVTADFNFPEWRYFGRGSGAGGVVHRFVDHR